MSMHKISLIVRIMGKNGSNISVATLTDEEKKTGPKFICIFLSFLFRKLFGYERATAHTQKFELTTLRICILLLLTHKGNCQITFKQYEW